MEPRANAPYSLEAVVAARVTKSSPVPVYVQIRDAIGDLLRELLLPPGTALPAEHVMCNRIGVSKMTLRQAYGLLERDGLIRRRRGLGTFVASPELEKSLPDMRSFTEEMVAQGKVATSRLLSFDLLAPLPAARDFFRLPEDEFVYTVRRLRLSDGVPAALESVEVPQSLCPHLERFDLASQSLYKVLEEHYKIQLGSCDQEVSAELPDKTRRQLLDLRSPDALLVIRRKSYATNGIPVELATTAYRGSIYRARIHAARMR